MKRIVREPDNRYWLWIPVVYSEKEDKYHRVLPDFLLPFKHYTVGVIRATLKDEQDLDLYDMPSDSSRIRWKKTEELQHLKKEKKKLLKSLRSLPVLNTGQNLIQTTSNGHNILFSVRYPRKE